MPEYASLLCKINNKIIFFVDFFLQLISGFYDAFMSLFCSFALDLMLIIFSFYKKLIFVMDIFIKFFYNFEACEYLINLKCNNLNNLL